MREAVRCCSSMLGSRIARCGGDIRRDSGRWTGSSVSKVVQGGVPQAGKTKQYRPQLL